MLVKMPQEIRVLKCFHCNLFQVDIVKKSYKWQCRVCNMKQTLRHEYFRGTGTECRVKVQELNMKEGQKESEHIQTFLGIFNKNDGSPILDDKEAKTSKASWEKVDNDRKDESKLPSSSNKDENVMFNFSQNKKWRLTSRPEQENISKFSKRTNQLRNKPKKSKWDNYL